MRITCEISTRDRYDVLPQALLSLALQTHKDFDVFIFDDSDNPKDIRGPCEPALRIFDYYGIGWRVEFGRRAGQHHNHQRAQELAKSDWIFRFDDDEVLEPNVLEKLIGNVRDDVGAVAGLVLPPAPSPVPADAANLISDLNLPNVQWFKQAPQLLEVEHLHSTFIYRRGLVDYELALSPAAHREETIFTYAIKRKGYKLLVDTSAVTWHFRADQGGIRSHRSPQFWDDDERIFNAKLQEWGVNCEPTKTIVLDVGRGDHCVVASLIPELKKKYGRLVMASCFPDILDACGVEQISIADAKIRLGNLDRFSIYRAMIDWNWKGSLEDAFRKLYDLPRKERISPSLLPSE